MDKKYLYILIAAIVIVLILVYWFIQKKPGAPAMVSPPETPAAVSEEAIAPAAEGVSRAANPLEDVITNPYENVKFNPFE